MLHRATALCSIWLEHALCAPLVISWGYPQDIEIRANCPQPEQFAVLPRFSLLLTVFKYMFVAILSKEPEQLATRDMHVLLFSNPLCLHPMATIPTLFAKTLPRCFILINPKTNLLVTVWSVTKKIGGFIKFALKFE